MLNGHLFELFKVMHKQVHQCVNVRWLRVSVWDLSSPPPPPDRWLHWWTAAVAVGAMGRGSNRVSGYDWQIKDRYERWRYAVIGNKCHGPLQPAYMSDMLLCLPTAESVSRVKWRDIGCSLHPCISHGKGEMRGWRLNQVNKLHDRKSVPQQLVARSEFGDITRGEIKGLDCIGITKVSNSKSDLQTHSTGHNDFLFVFHSNYVSILHCFRDERQEYSQNSLSGLQQVSNVFV